MTVGRHGNLHHPFCIIMNGTGIGEVRCMKGTPRILLVDNDASLLRVTERQLDRAGFSVTTARSADEALASLNASAFDLVITDVAMEGMDGLEFLAAVRRRRPVLPVIVMTAGGNAERRRAARKLKAADFLEKPFCRETLLASVRAALPGRVV